MSTKRQKHRGIPSINSTRSKCYLGKDGRVHKEQRMIGNHVLHNTKGWRKITVVDMLGYKNQIQAVMNKLIKLN